MADQKVEKLKKLLELLKEDTITPAQLKDSVMLMVNLVKKGQEDAQTLSKESKQSLQQALTYLEAQHKELLGGVEQKTADQVAQLQKKTNDVLDKVNQALDEISAIQVEDGKDADEELIVQKVLAQIPAPEPEIEETPEQIVEKLNTLKSALDWKVIKNAPKPQVINNITEGGRGFIETPLKAGANITITKDALGNNVITGAAGGGTVASVASADGSITVTNPTTTADLAVVKAPKWSTARNLAGNSVDGSANVAFANKFIVQGTVDAGLSAAQFLGALGTGIVKNTTTTGVLSIAVAGDFPTLNQSTTGSAATLTTPRTIAGVSFDGSANISLNNNAITNGAGYTTNTGTVATVSVVSANGFTGTVATATTTPAITLTTSITGILKGNSTAISAAINSDLPVMTATVGGAVPTPPNNTTTFLRGDGTFATPAGSGDMVLASAQTNSGIKTFLDTTMKLRNVANTFDGYFVNTNTADRIYTLKDAAGTLAFTTDITGTNSGINSGDQTITLTGGVTGSGTGSFAATVVTNANLTGVITSVGNATSIASQTGTGTKFVVDTSPTLVTPTLGVATATRLGIGAAADATRVLYVTGDVSGGNALVERVNATTNAVVGTMIIQGTSTGTAADGFGSAFQFAIKDNIGGPNNIADIRGIRSGALNAGKMTFSTSTGGAMTEAMAISNAQIVTLTNAGTIAGSVATIDGTQTLTNKTLTTPVINGTITGTGQATAATASTIAMRDTSANLSANNFIEGFTTTATAAGTTVMTVTSKYIQVWTGTLAQTVQLPTTSVAQGQQYLIINQSTGLVTVQSSGANTIVILAAGTSGLFTAVVATPTTAANWASSYSGVNAASGKVATINNNLTFAGTDATTMTFPSTSATIARTDAANTFTGVQTMTSPNFTTPVLGTPTSGTLTNCTGLPIAGLTASTVTALGVGSIELGHATDTTLARVSAGIVSIEGVTIDTASNTLTLTNKRITKRIGTEASSATSTPTADTVDQWNVTALAAADAFAAPTGTPTDGQDLVIRIKDNGTARALTWNAIYRASSDLALPSTTIISKTLYLGFRYNAADSKWDLLALLNNI